MLRVLTFTTLYPNAERPNHGVFVETRLRQTLARHAFKATVLAPVPYFPFTSDAFGSYARFARVPLQEQRNDLTVHHPRFLTIPKVGMTAAAWLLYLGALRACRRFGFDKATVDVIDAHYFYPDGVAAALLSRRLGIPFVVTARGTDLNVLSQFARIRRQIVWAAQQATSVITVSAALRQRLLELRVDPAKSVVLRNGVNLDLFTPDQKDGAKHKLGLRGFTILSVGGLVWRKGHQLTIEAVASLPDCTLLIAGGGPMRGALEARASALGVGDRVRFLGEVPHAELAQYYSAADVSVLMSESEGWANVLLESMACGTPVIATNVGGNGEIIIRHEAGLLLRERSAQALAQAVRDLRADLPDRAATRRHAEAYGWGAVAAANYAVLQAASRLNVMVPSVETIAAEAMRNSTSG